MTTNKKICPLLCIAIIKPYKVEEEAVFCIESKCGWWNEAYGACGMRLASKREGNVQ